MNVKTCKMCRAEKPLSAFNKDPTRRDGHHPYCTQCKRITFKDKPRPGRKRKPKGTARREALRSARASRTEKVCSGCGELKPLALYHKQASVLDGHASRCKACVHESTVARYDPARSRVYYLGRRAELLRKTKDSRDSRKRAFILRLGGCCADCGTSPDNPWPLASFCFHHPESDKKEAGVASIMARRGEERAWAEAQRCVVLCNNCHARRHAT